MSSSKPHCHAVARFGQPGSVWRSTGLLGSVSLTAGLSRNCENQVDGPVAKANAGEQREVAMSKKIAIDEAKAQTVHYHKPP